MFRGTNYIGGNKEMKRLNIGSGTDYREGWDNIDYNKEYHPEIIWDLTKMPWPIEDSTYDEIAMIHVLEHFHDPILIVNEIYRISKNGAKVLIKVPHHSSHFSKGDLTHHHQFSTREFTHFQYDEIYYNSSTRFKVKTSLNCVNAKNRLPAKIFNYIFNPIVNFNFSLTENLLCKFIPIYEVIFELEVIK